MLCPPGGSTAKPSTWISGKPIPSLMVSAGGAQTISAADGSFLLEGLPPGVHNLTLYAMDGSYQPFPARGTRGGRLDYPGRNPNAAGKILQISSLSSSPPKGPCRWSRCAWQATCTRWATPSPTWRSGASTLPVNMPRMSTLPDGRYTLTLSLADRRRYPLQIYPGRWLLERRAQPGWQHSPAPVYRPESHRPGRGYGRHVGGCRREEPDLRCQSASRNACR